VSSAPQTPDELTQAAGTAGFRIAFIPHGSKIIASGVAPKLSPATPGGVMELASVFPDTVHAGLLKKVTTTPLYPVNVAHDDAQLVVIAS
jgi:alkanesulfonate monooxygenase SsuD/methylene tetrahydromethanopterin reductase-like flavin-dependent oxidoreductase (luciferase family)